eukprot:6662777-Pyramimonas_sp.AAC.1
MLFERSCAALKLHLLAAKGPPTSVTDRRNSCLLIADAKILDGARLASKKPSWGDYAKAAKQEATQTNPHLT